MGWYRPPRHVTAWYGSVEQRGPTLQTKPQVRRTKGPAEQGLSRERTTGFEPATLTLATTFRAITL